jgi:nucleoside-diphosphate-sugar epimerase
MAGALGVETTIRHDGDVPEYIEFRSADTTLRDRFGFVPSIPLDEGVRRLAAFFATDEEHAAGRKA